jgi:multidrug efflux pump subunit AcrA (membrane-fusion protein)
LIPQATAASNTDTPILSIATLQPVRVYADVPQDVTPYMADGDPAIVTVTQYPKRQFRGTRHAHPDALAATTRTMLVEVDLPNTDSALLPGMYGTLRMQVPERDVARVADDAIGAGTDRDQRARPCLDPGGAGAVARSGRARAQRATAMSPGKQRTMRT